MKNVKKKKPFKKVKLIMKSIKNVASKKRKRMKKIRSIFLNKIKGIKEGQVKTMDG